MSKIVITGANRGIGLGFVKKYITAGKEVIACCRKPEAADELQSLRESQPELLTVKELDISNFAAIDTLSNELSGTPIDILINNAGVYLDKGRTSIVGELNFDLWRETFETNLFGTIRMAEAFLPSLRLGSEKKIAFLSSLMGSIADNSSGGSYFYRTSKTALNSAIRSLAHDLKGEGIAVVSLHPGWVQTDMGGGGANLSVEDSVSGLSSVIDNLNLSNSGAFINYDGRELAW